MNHARYLCAGPIVDRLLAGAHRLAWRPVDVVSGLCSRFRPAEPLCEQSGTGLNGRSLLHALHHDSVSLSFSYPIDAQQELFMPLRHCIIDLMMIRILHY